MTTFNYKGHQVELKPIKVDWNERALMVIKIDGEYQITRGLYSESEAADVARKIIDAARPTS